MHILIANAILPPFGGLGSWTETMVSDLISRGFKVDVFTLEPGIYSEKIANSISVKELWNRPRDFYDIALIQHNNCLEIIRRLHVAKKICMTTHSRYCPIDQPIKGAHYYVTISEEIKAHMLKSGFEARIIKSPIDTKRYRPLNPLKKKLHNVGLLSNYRKAEALIRGACLELDLEFTIIGGENPIWEITEAINYCDLVVSVGRGALEAMSCGRAVIVFDDRGYYPAWSDGYFYPEKGLEMAQFNYTGRRFRRDANMTTISAMMDEYQSDDGQKNRQYVVEHHSVKSVVDTYLELITSGALPRSLH